MIPKLMLREQSAVRPDLCIVLMPFAAKFENVFEIVRHAVQACGLTCTRADSLTTTGQVTDDIWNSIRDARVLVADLTGGNPNVFYEIGAAHALNKPVILLNQQGDRVPFDLRGIRYVTYDSKALRGLAEALPRFIRSSLEIPIPRVENVAFDDAGPPNVRLTSVKIPDVVTLDQPVHFEVRARNYGGPAGQAYFSVSFPLGFDRVNVFHSDCQSKVGLRNEPWANERIVLRYPIAESFSYGEPFWLPQVEHSMTVEACATAKGLLQVYFSCSCQTDPLPFIYDPSLTDSPLRDQRGEPVYCGIVDVRHGRI
jgi:hypothetical protein